MIEQRPEQRPEHRPLQSAEHSKGSASRRGGRLSSLEALERGFVLFQSTFAREAWRFYVGALPFVICFIPIWVVDGQIQMSGGIVALQAVLLSAAFLLRASMVAQYMQRVRERAYGVPAWKPDGILARAAGTGRLLLWKAALGFIALASLPTIAGASWFYGACEFATFATCDDADERGSFGGCLALSSQWFGGGVLLLLMLIPLWGAVWINEMLMAAVLPALLHSIFGVDTFLSTTIGVQSLVRSSAFWLSLFAGAWVALDPIVKCAYVVVYQHSRSRREGDDLRGLLASMPHGQERKAKLVASMTRFNQVARIGIALVLIAVMLNACPPARAAEPRLNQAAVGTSSDPARAARIEKLGQALNDEAGREIYRWHDDEHPEPPTWFDRLLAKIKETLHRAWDNFWKFLKKLWPSGLSLPVDYGKGRAWQIKDLRLWIGLVVALTILITAALFWLRRRRYAVQLSIPVATSPLPDLTDTSIAIDRSEDEWFALASRFENEGELRLALRAAYLGLLAGLARREWLTIRANRTNREYLEEFTRRWHRRPQAALEVRAEIPARLRGSLRVFDRVWYGSHEATPTAVATYRQDLRELLDHV
jgi:hypothetical protein